MSGLWFSLVRRHLLVCEQHYSRRGCEWIISCCLWKYLIMGKCCFMLLKWCCFKLNYTSFEQAMCWELFVMEENKDSLISFTQNNFWKLNLWLYKFSFVYCLYWERYCGVLRTWPELIYVTLGNLTFTSK